MNETADQEVIQAARDIMQQRYVEGKHQVGAAIRTRSGNLFVGVHVEASNGRITPEVLRLENLDTDLRPPKSALDFTRDAVDDDAANSCLPFLGLDSMRQAAAGLVSRQSGCEYDWKTECVISAGGLSGIFNVLLATLEPGDEVLLTEPIYVGLINRVRLAGGVPRLIPLIPSTQGWRLDTKALANVDPRPVKAALLMSPSMPTGAVLGQSEWQALVEFCEEADCRLINDSAMERILFDGRQPIHPASFPGMRERVITVGSASKEYRMIGWFSRLSLSLVERSVPSTYFETT